MRQLELPKSYLFQLDTPWILFGGRLLQPKQRTAEEDNYAEFHGLKFSLEEIISPKTLEDLYFRHSSDSLERFQQSFVQEYFNQEFRSRETITESIKKNKVLSLIVEKIIPVITSDRLEKKIDELVREDVPLASRRLEIERQETAVPAAVVREVNTIKQRLISQIEQEYRNLSLESTPEEDEVDQRINNLLRPALRTVGGAKFTRLREDSALSELVGNNNLMAINGKVYSLFTIPEMILLFKQGLSSNFRERVSRLYTTTNPASIVQMIEQNKSQIDHKYLSRIINKIESSKLKIDRRYYIPFLWGKTVELEKKYMRFLEKKAKIAAIEHSEYQTRELYQVAQEQGRLEGIARSANYERNKAGFEKRGEDYYVFVITPPYALKSPHVQGRDCYVPFSPAKIGVRIKYYHDPYYGRSNFEVGLPVIMHQYKHPFLGDAPAFKNICLGSWSSSGYATLERLPPEQKALALLSQAQKTLMMGYRTGDNPYMRLLKEYWSPWLTREECERRNLVVLNEFR